jgi:Mn-dependent DtxR family transcriptional regulator
VNDVASRLRLSMEVTLAAMMELERQGLVRVSKDKIPLNRLVAITDKGRKELKR